MSKFIKIAYKHNSTVEKLVQKALAHPNKTFKGGKAYTIVYDTEFNGNLILEHYGTKIITVNPNTKEYTLGGGYSGSDADAVSTVFNVLGIPAQISRKNGEFKVVEASKKVKSSTTPTSPKPTNPAAEGYTWAWSSDLDTWVQAPKDNPGVVSMIGNTTGNQSIQIQSSSEEEDPFVDVTPYLVINYAKELYLDNHLSLPEIAEEIQKKWPKLDTKRAINLATKGYNAGKEGKSISASSITDLAIQAEEEAQKLADEFLEGEITVDDLEVSLNNLEGLKEEQKQSIFENTVSKKEDISNLVALESMGNEPKLASEIKCFNPSLLEKGLITQAGYKFNKGMYYKVSSEGIEYMLKIAKKIANNK